MERELGDLYKNVWLMGFADKIKNSLLPKAQPTGNVTNTSIADNLTHCLIESIDKESVGSSLIFNTSFLVFLHPNVYADRLGTFPALFNEVTKKFEKEISKRVTRNKKAVVVSPGWEMRFFSAELYKDLLLTEHDIVIKGNPVGHRKSRYSAQENATKVTIIPGQAATFIELNFDFSHLEHINSLDEGWYTTPFGFLNKPKTEEKMHAVLKTQASTEHENVFAVLECQTDKSKENIFYEMKVSEIVIARMEIDNLKNSNYLLIDSKFVSSLHARIRVNRHKKMFQIASFSRFETKVNSTVVLQSIPSDPVWYDLPKYSEIILNHRVTIAFRGNG